MSGRVYVSFLSAFRRITVFFETYKVKRKNAYGVFLKTEFGFSTSSCLSSHKLSKKAFFFHSWKGVYVCVFNIMRLPFLRASFRKQCLDFCHLELPSRRPLMLYQVDGMSLRLDNDCSLHIFWNWKLTWNVLLVRGSNLPEFSLNKLTLLSTDRKNTYCDLQMTLAHHECLLLTRLSALIQIQQFKEYLFCFQRIAV